MSGQLRKLILVRREPDDGYTLMVEFHGQRTCTKQLTHAEGEAFLRAATNAATLAQFTITNVKQEVSR